MRLGPLRLSPPGSHGCACMWLLCGAAFRTILFHPMACMCLIELRVHSRDGVPREFDPITWSLHGHVSIKRRQCKALLDFPRFLSFSIRVLSLSLIFPEKNNVAHTTIFQKTNPEIEPWPAVNHPLGRPITQFSLDIQPETS